MTDKRTEGLPEQLVDGLKKVFLAGVGAVATVAEKAEEVVGDLIKKGELTVEQGKEVCEKFTQDIKEKCAEMARDDAAAERVMDAVESLTPQERAALKAKLAAMDETGASSTYESGNDESGLR